MELAFSTAWADGDMKRIHAVRPHIDSLEIGSKGDGSFFRELQAYIRDESVPVTSVHAVAYPGKAVHEAYYAPRLASLEKKNRTCEIDELSKTAEWALHIGARALVLHTGRVEDEELKNAYREYKRVVREGALLKDLSGRREELVRRRRELSGPHVESIIEGLTILCARFHEIHFYIETRVHFYEIPIPDELELIFREVPQPNLGYWHDMGHTYTLDALGFVPMYEWQHRFYQRCGGAHVHDVDHNLVDHYPPGEGMLDMHGLLEQFSSEVLLTLEINARNDYESVVRGIRHLRADRITV
jgi:sugar phosphate isomerase/epimerase